MKTAILRWTLTGVLIAKQAMHSSWEVALDVIEHAKHVIWLTKAYAPHATTDTSRRMDFATHVMQLAKRVR